MKRALLFGKVKTSRRAGRAFRVVTSHREVPRLSTPIRVVASLAAALLLVNFGAPAAHAAGPVLSVSSASLSRDALSQLSFDATVSVDGVQGSGKVCSSSNYDCNLYLNAQYADGGNTILQRTTIAWGRRSPIHTSSLALSASPRSFRFR
jgi:hypothetical protein